MPCPLIRRTSNENHRRTASTHGFDSCLLASYNRIFLIVIVIVGGMGRVSCPSGRRHGKSNAGPTNEAPAEQADALPSLNELDDAHPNVKKMITLQAVNRVRHLNLSIQFEEETHSLNIHEGGDTVIHKLNAFLAEHLSITLADVPGGNTPGGQE